MGGGFPAERRRAKRFAKNNVQTCRRHFLADGDRNAAGVGLAIISWSLVSTRNPVNFGGRRRDCLMAMRLPLRVAVANNSLWRVFLLIADQKSRQNHKASTTRHRIPRDLEGNRIRTLATPDNLGFVAPLCIRREIPPHPVVAVATVPMGSKRAPC